MTERSAALSTLSVIIGWIYFVAWSVSFYPQVIVNYKRKRVDGLSFEYLAYNLTGFLFYFTFTLVSFIVQRTNGLPESVETNDVAFAAHAFILTAVTGFQCFIYERRGQKFNYLHAIMVFSIWILAIYSAILSVAHILPWYSLAQHSSYQYNFIEFLGFCKLAISFVKYVPQAYLNFKRQSTVGWPIANVLLDLTGGTGSFLQQFIDAYNTENWGIFSSNIPKLVLAIESVSFDILFIIQHYVLYRGNEPQMYVVEYQPVDGDGDDGSPNKTISPKIVNVEQQQQQQSDDLSAKFL